MFISVHFSVIYIFKFKPANAHPKYTIVGAFIEAMRLYVFGVFVCLRIKNINGLATFMGLNHSVRSFQFIW